MIEINERIPEYSDKDIKEKIILNIRDISHTVLALYEGRSSQKRVLIALLENGEISQRELTARLGITAASMSELITRIEDNGYITRRASKADRRIHIISLTASGRKRAIDITEKRKQRHEKMFNCFSDDEKKSFLSYLERLNLDWDKKYR
ncbi:MAG: MarR family transcriptional regulator [Ruminococcus sp.]|nr:MarR family transcriptional regulator [Ruminococcus sp.]